MDQGVSAGEVGGVLAGIIALLGALGAGLRWLLGWNDGRQALREAKLTKWEEALARRDQAERQQTEARLRTVEEKLAAVSIALFEALGELQRLDPGSPMLAQARQVLKRTFPVETEIPAEMQDLLCRME